MMKGLLSLLLRNAAVLLLKNYRRLSLDLLRIRAAVWYVQGVRSARKAFIAVVALALCLIVGGGGFMLFHVGLFLLLPSPWNAVLLMSLGALYVVVTLLILRWLCSERTWMKFSKAGHFAAVAARKKD
jgi:hypothetical protein